MLGIHFYIDMRHHFLPVVLVSILFSVPASARLRSLAGFEDIQDMAARAPFIFRGEVVDFKPADTKTLRKEGLAVVAIDRWYRGSSSNSFINLHFAYDGGADGHNCRNLEIGTYWIVFAKQGANQALEMMDDCDGALRVSALLGSITSDGVLFQMEKDFVAGLDDTAADLRIESLLRLAALSQLHSTEVLHRLSTAGSEEESKWAIFVELKAGDISDLPLAVPLLLSVQQHQEPLVHYKPNGFKYTETFAYPEPEGFIADAISKLRTPKAIPILTKLANEAPDDYVRNCANEALLAIKKLTDKNQN